MKPLFFIPTLKNILKWLNTFQLCTIKNTKRMNDLFCLYEQEWYLNHLNNYNKEHSIRTEPPGTSDHRLQTGWLLSPCWQVTGSHSNIQRQATFNGPADCSGYRQLLISALCSDISCLKIIFGITQPWKGNDHCCTDTTKNSLGGKESFVCV